MIYVDLVQIDGFLTFTLEQTFTNILDWRCKINISSSNLYAWKCPIVSNAVLPFSPHKAVIAFRYLKNEYYMLMAPTMNDQILKVC